MVEDQIHRPRNKVLRDLNQKPHQLRNFPVELGWRLFWAICAMAGIVLTSVVLGRSSPLMTVIVIAAIAALYYLLVWQRDSEGKSAITTMYVKGAKLARNGSGMSTYRSNDAFVGTTPDRKRHKPDPMKQFGRVEFVPHQMGRGSDGNQRVLGTVFDHRYDTWTVALGLGMSSTYSVSDEEWQLRVRNFGTLYDNVPEHPGVYRFGFKIQTLKGEFTDPKGIVKQLQQGSGLNPDFVPDNELFDKRVSENGKNYFNPRVIFQFTFRADYLRKSAKLFGSYPAAIENELDVLYGMVMGDPERGRRGESPIGATKAMWLDYNAMILANLLITDPVNGQVASTEWRGRKRKATDLFGEAEAWPYSYDFDMKKHPTWGRMGDTFIRTFYAKRFSKSEMADDQLWPLIEAPVPKTISAVFEMLPQDKALKSAEVRARIAEEEIRTTYDQRAATQVKTQRAQTSELEIASDVGEVGRTNLFVVLYGEGSPEDLDRGQVKLQGGWTKSKMLLRAMTEDHGRGFEPHLLTNRGLPHIRG